MESFKMNGYLWHVIFVEPNDHRLIDRTNRLTIATTDPVSKDVYLSNLLYGDFLMHVFLHELGHCTIVSFDLTKEIRRLVYPEYWIEAEEKLCNFIADYGFKIFSIAYKTMGHNAWKVIPTEFEKMFA